MAEKRSKSMSGEPPADLPEEPRADGPGELHDQIAALAEQVRMLSVKDTAPRPPAAASAPPDAATGLPAAEVIATAERAAAEIRESARHEAERIRSQRRQGLTAAVTELFAVLRRQRVALATLAVEIARVEESAEILREQLEALEVELAETQQILTALMSRAAADR